MADPTKKPFSTSEMNSFTALVDRFANDESFAKAVTTHKPGDEVKLKQFLAESGFRGVEVTIDANSPSPQQTRVMCYRVCLCSTIVPGLCVCVSYCHAI